MVVVVGEVVVVVVGEVDGNSTETKTESVAEFPEVSYTTIV